MHHSFLVNDLLTKQSYIQMNLGTVKKLVKERVSSFSKIIQQYGQKLKAPNQLKNDRCIFSLSLLGSPQNSNFVLERFQVQLGSYNLREKLSSWGKGDEGEEEGEVGRRGRRG